MKNLESPQLLHDAQDRRAEAFTEEDIIGAVADLLTNHGYQFIPDSMLPEMKRALRPFLVHAA